MCSILCFQQLHYLLYQLMLLSGKKVFNLPKSKASTFVLKLFKLVGSITNLIMSSLSDSVFKASKSF